MMIFAYTVTTMFCSNKSILYLNVSYLEMYYFLKSVSIAWLCEIAKVFMCLSSSAFCTISMCIFLDHRKWRNTVGKWYPWSNKWFTIKTVSIEGIENDFFVFLLTCVLFYFIVLLCQTFIFIFHQCHLPIEYIIYNDFL